MTVNLNGALYDWVNTSAVLAGPGKPLAKGAMRHPPRSPGRGCYVTIAIESDVEGLDAEGVTVGADVTFTTYSVTDAESSRLAGIALAGELMRLSRTKPVVASASAQLLMAAPVGWPEAVDDDSGEYRHTVRATVYAAPA